MNNSIASRVHQETYDSFDEIWVFGRVLVHSIDYDDCWLVAFDEFTGPEIHKKAICKFHDVIYLGPGEMQPVK